MPEVEDIFDVEEEAPMRVVVLFAVPTSDAPPKEDEDIVIEVEVKISRIKKTSED